jgi:hypothetical protein
VGAGYALGKAGLYEPGFRLRAVGAYGRYHYDGTLLDNGAFVPTTFDGEDAFLSALVGYQFRPGRLIVKLFAGIEAEDQHIVPHDPHNSVQGSELGLRLQEETWLDISPRLYLSADASYGTAFQEYCALARLGFRVRPRFSLGLEGGALGNEEYDAGRGGGFVANEFPRHRIYALRRLHRQLSRRRAEQLCRPRRLPVVLRLGDRQLCQIALPAPLRQCLAFSAARFETNQTRFAVAASPSLVVHPV